MENLYLLSKHCTGHNVGRSSNQTYKTSRWAPGRTLSIMRGVGIKNTYFHVMFSVLCRNQYPINYIQCSRSDQSDNILTRKYFLDLGTSLICPNKFLLNTLTFNGIRIWIFVDNVCQHSPYSVSSCISISSVAFLLFQ